MFAILYLVGNFWLYEIFKKTMFATKTKGRTTFAVSVGAKEEQMPEY